MLESLKRGLRQVVADASVHAAPTIKTYKPLDADGRTRPISVIVKRDKLLLDVRDSVELLSAGEARMLAAALIEAADVLDGTAKPTGGSS